MGTTYISYVLRTYFCRIVNFGFLKDTVSVRKMVTGGNFMGKKRVFVNIIGIPVVIRSVNI